jgi:hypothetical protein
MGASLVNIACARQPGRSKGLVTLVETHVLRAHADPVSQHVISVQDPWYEHSY